MEKTMIFLGMALLTFSCVYDATGEEDALKPEENARIEKNEEVIKELSTATDELKKYNDDAVEALNDLDSL